MDMVAVASDRRWKYWRSMSSCRQSEAGHILLHLAGGSNLYAERLAGQATTATQDKIHRAVFVSRDQRAATGSSCLASSPGLADLAASDEDMAAVRPADLHQLTWVGLRYYNP